MPCDAMLLFNAWTAMRCDAIVFVERAMRCDAMWFARRADDAMRFVSLRRANDAMGYDAKAHDER